MTHDRNKYLEYINNSSEWKIKRAQVFSLKGRKCERCGGTNRIHVHHGTYTRLFNEMLEDLFVLCGYCHGEYHKQTRVITIQSTEAFIKNQVLPQIKIKKGKPKNKKPVKKFKKGKKQKREKVFGYFNAISAQRAETAQGIRRLFAQGKMTREEYMEKLRTC